MQLQHQQHQQQPIDSQPMGPPPITVDPSSLARYDPLNSSYKPPVHNFTTTHFF